MGEQKGGKEREGVGGKIGDFFRSEFNDPHNPESLALIREQNRVAQKVNTNLPLCLLGIDGQETTRNSAPKSRSMDDDDSMLGAARGRARRAEALALAEAPRANDRVAEIAPKQAAAPREFDVIRI